MATKEIRKTGIMDSPTIVTAKRALRVSKINIIMAAFFTVMAIVAWSNIMFSSTSKGTAVLALPLDVLPFLLFTIPALLLFVYDKNDGVLEYLLSLGMTQRDIYTRYLKAALLLVLLLSIIFIPAVLAYTYLFWGGASAVAAILPIPLLAIPFSLAVVSFMTLGVMIFSSWQRSRPGSSQPLGLTVGFLVVVPAYLTALTFSFDGAIYADIAIMAAIALVTSIFLRSSEKLIRREKLLP
jgi:ABC-type transport system involved in multi-copper enzyme maturation permease subunit